MPVLQASDPASSYAELLAQGHLLPDEAQAEAVGKLQLLYNALGEGRKLWRKAKTPPGLYVWGNVGRGKSMLMELFFVTAPVERKRRVHFHAFMQEVYGRIHSIRQAPGYRQGSGDPVAILIQQLAEEVRLLCFDELQATDVADASLIFRIFEGLMEAGVVMVSTSNHPPESLYTGGVQRERFEKLTALIRRRMDVFALTSPRDYRHSQARALRSVYFSPLGPDARRFVEEAVAALAPGVRPQIRLLQVQGRDLRLTMYDDDIAVASFHELCESALGPADYLAIANYVTTLVLTDIPVLTPEKRNEAKRFVTLVDALYEAKTMLICTAAAAPEQLYPQGDGSFEFARTVSRLAEMASVGWVKD